MSDPLNLESFEKLTSYSMNVSGPEHADDRAARLKLAADAAAHERLLEVAVGGGVFVVVLVMLGLISGLIPATEQSRGLAMNVLSAIGSGVLVHMRGRKR